MKKGFTLIELLVVIAIISLLSSIIFGSLQQARAKARDKKRIQDLVQLRNALELYREANGKYPSDPNLTFLGSPDTRAISCWTCGTPGYLDNTRLTALTPFLNTRPSDPSEPFSGATNNGYWYKVNNSCEDYKVAIENTVEDINNIPTIMRDSTNWNAAAPNTAVIFSSEVSRTWSRSGTTFAGSSSC